MKNRGFTLIELMIVVAIIAIIAAIAIPNLLRSRMAANEAAAIAATKAFCSAEDIYRRTDWDKDGILEYASRISGTKSLYMDNSGTEIALVDRSFALAEGSTGASSTAVPKAGYVFWVLTSQGNNAPGKAKSYYSAGKMTSGYGLSSVPFDYDAGGRSTFTVNNTGTIYQKDLGASFGHLTAYDPDSTWAPAE